MACLQLGDIAPNFTAHTTFGTIDFHNWIGESWVILFSHPADYTPVCTTELGTASKLKVEFEKRKVKMIALSVDEVHQHLSWINDINETQQTEVDFPIIADPEKKVSELYGMIHPNTSLTHTVRSVFIIGPDKKIKLTINYPASTGRNFNELLRVIDSLQLSSNYSVVTPANWEFGQDCIIVPSVTNEEADLKFPKGYKEIKPYLRVTPQPDL
jgi:alkyl hydroperoxide reductase subunit AhpC